MGAIVRGFDTRPAARRYFNTDAESVVVAVLEALARDGEIVELKSRIVHVDRLQLVHHEGDRSVFEADCGKGTYVRALARDLGLPRSTTSSTVVTTTCPAASCRRARARSKFSRCSSTSGW